MPKKTSKPRPYTTVSIPKGLAERVDNLIKSSREYQNKGDFILEAVRKRLDELGVPEPQPPRPVLEHFNLNEYGVVVLDRSLDPPKGQLVQVDFKENKVFCEYDESNHCRHIDFAMDLPEVQEILKRKGWKPK